MATHNPTLAPNITEMPLAYSVQNAVLVGLPIFLIILVIVIGNSLVIVAISMDKKLRLQYQNWLILSLAVADLLVGLLIMPLTFLYEIRGQWILGRAVCEMWLALDVLFVTASITNMCAISLDRYWSVTDPMRYPAARSRRMNLKLIGGAWAIATAVSLPPLFGWSNTAQTMQNQQCMLSQDIAYVLYSSLGSFFMPVVVLMCVYTKIYSITKTRMRTKLKHVKTQEETLASMDPQHIRSPSVSASPRYSDDLVEDKESETSPEHQQSIPMTEMQLQSEDMVEHRNGTTEMTPRLETPPVLNIRTQELMMERAGAFADIIHVTLNTPNLKRKLGQRAQSISGMLQASRHMFSFRRQDSTTAEGSEVTGQNCRLRPALSEITESLVTHENVEQAALSSKSNEITHATVCSEGPSSVPQIFVSDHDDPRSRLLDAPNTTNAARGWSYRYSAAHLADAGGGRRGSAATPVANAVVQQIKKKRREMKRQERKSTFILGLLLGAFIACWLPFFTMYILAAFGVGTPELVFDIFFWIGYCNSGINPIIYTIFNMEFRRAFIKILSK